MTIFITGLYVDLRNRLQKMIVALETKDTDSVVAAKFKNTTIEILGQLSHKIQGIIDSGILSSPKFMKNAIIKYNSINNQFLEVEGFRFMAIVRWTDKAEGFFEKVVSKIYKEIDALRTTPFITTMSNSDSYFWAYPKYEMIALPIGEEEHILNLSDLYHEIGHLFFHKHYKFFLNKHLDFLEKFYNESELQLKYSGQVSGLGEQMSKTLNAWNSTWNEEFCCDLIATYLVGPAYAWTNMKICTLSSSSNNVYSYQELLREHPPDEARMRGIFKMLELIGMDEAVDIVKSAWVPFEKRTNNQRPQYYETFFAQDLIDSIANDVFEACKNLSLRTYPEQLVLIGENRSVAKSINDAWISIRKDPLSFESWEKEELKEIIN